MLKHCGVCLLLLLWMTSIRGAVAQSEINGRWQASGVPGSPWTFDLKVSGTTVTGRAMQNGGEPGPVDIVDGKLEGNLIEFKCKSPDGGKIISYNGRLDGGEIAFTRTAQVRADAPIDNSVLGQQADTGSFGVRGPRQFLAKRVGPVPGQLMPAAEMPTGPVNATGRWENVQWNLDMWIFELQADGLSLTGNIVQRTGPGRQGAANPLPTPIYDGKVEGNTVSFKSRSPMGGRVVSFTGKIYGDEIDINRTIEIPPNGDPGGNAIYGAYARQSFVARRAPSVTPPVSPAQDEMSHAQAKWSARTLKNYAFTIAWKCLCPLPEMAMKFRATDFAGTVDLATIPGQQAIKPVVERYGTFEQIFELLRTMASKQPYRMKIDYDPLLGFPVSGEIDPGGISPDDNIEFKVTGFQDLDAAVLPVDARHQDAYAIYALLISGDARSNPNNTNSDTNYLIAASLLTDRNGFNGAQGNGPGPFDMQSTLAPKSCAETFPANRPGFREVQNDFNQRKNTGSNLERDFKLDKPYQLLDARQTAEFMVARVGRNINPLTGQVIGNSAAPYMGARKLFRVSDVFFDANRSLALVYSSVENSPVDMTGGWKLFAKDPAGQWAESRTWPDCGTGLGNAAGPAPATLFVSHGPDFHVFSIEGAVTYFAVTRSGSVVEEESLNCCGFQTSMLLPPGDYDLRSYVRGCDGNCGNQGPPQSECRASFKLDPGKTLYAVREESARTGDCTVTFSSSPPKP